MRAKGNTGGGNKQNTTKSITTLIKYGVAIAPHGAVICPWGGLKKLTTAELSHFDLPPHRFHRPMGCLPPHEEVTAPWKDNRQTPRGTPHGARFAAWRRCHRAEYLAPLGRYLAHWAPPAKSKWPLELFQGPFAANSTGHYSSKINLRVRRPPSEAEGALKYVEC